jgi:RHS repeat-associated protein
VTAATNVLGPFTYGYDGVTGRLASVTYPNGQASSFSYFGNVGDRRLQTIHHRKADASTLSRFDYTYDSVGNILTWQQQVDNAAPTVYQLGYDAADELTAATNQTTDAAPTVLKRYAYAYDPAGNRTSEQIDDAATTTSYDALNRLRSQQGGGPLVFTGTVSKPARVMIQGQPVTVDSTNRFSGSVPAPGGTTRVVIAATDGSGNQGTASYDVDQASASKTLTYDANGNLTADGVRTLEWDARNQLLAVSQGSHRSEFTYDGWRRRVRIVEKDSGVVTTNRQFVWCGSELCEERDTSGATVTKRFFSQGVQDTGTSYLYTSDHLGSVRELMDETGAVRARYDYDPWGLRTKASGDKDAAVGFTGHYEHAATGLTLAPFRAYDSSLGLWISEDPAGMIDGPLLYGYVGHNPIGYVDPTGEQTGAAIGGVVGGLVGFMGGGGLAVASGGVLTPAIVECTALGSVGGALTGQVLENAIGSIFEAHKTKIRPSTEEKHEEGEARVKKDKGGEKADWPDGPRDPPRRRPPWWPKTGPWPPK